MVLTGTSLWFMSRCAFPVRRLIDAFLISSSSIWRTAVRLSKEKAS